MRKDVHVTRFAGFDIDHREVRVGAVDPDSGIENGLREREIGSSGTASHGGSGSGGWRNTAYRGGGGGSLGGGRADWGRTGDRRGGGCGWASGGGGRIGAGWRTRIRESRRFGKVIQISPHLRMAIL